MKYDYELICEKEEEKWILRFWPKGAMEGHFGENELIAISEFETQSNSKWTLFDDLWMDLMFGWEDWVLTCWLNGFLRFCILGFWSRHDWCLNLM